MSKKIQRIIQIHELLVKESGLWTCGKLSVRFGVSKQQIQRDIQKLRESGFEILSSYEGYRLIGGEKSSPAGGDDE